MDAILKFFDPITVFVKNVFFLGKTGITDEILNYIIIGLLAALSLFTVIMLVRGIVKGHFFGTLAKFLLAYFLLSTAAFVSLYVRQTIELVKADTFTFDALLALAALITADSVPALSEFSVLLSKLELSFITADNILYFYHGALLLVSVILVIILAVIIKKSGKRRAAHAEAAAALTEVAPESADPVAEAAAALAPETADEAVSAEEAASEEETPAEEPACAEPAEEEAPFEETPAEEESPCETDAEEDTDAEAAADEAPAYPTLDAPVFFPIPGTVFDEVDFTDPARDGFRAAPGVRAEATADLMTDEQAEQLTAVVYRRAGGEIAEIGLDCLNANFLPNSYVDAKILARLGLIPADAKRIALLPSGTLDKPLLIEASEFSPEACKMVTLACGRIIHLMQ